MVKRPAAARKPGPKPAAPRPPALEWAAAGVGLLLIGLVLALLISQTAAPSGPPILRIARHAPGSNTAGHTVEVEIANDGAAAASAIVVEGVLRRQGAVAETAEVTLDYVPARSTRKATLVFQADPTTGALELRVKGYVEP